MPRLRSVEDDFEVTLRLKRVLQTGGVGTYFYPASGYDLTPLLLLPNDNPVGCRLLTVDDLICPIPVGRMPLIPLLCDVEFDPNHGFRDQPHQGLWERFGACANVRVIGAILPNMTLCLAEIRRRFRGASIHPFLFLKGNAHEVLSRSIPTVAPWWLALVRCSGFSGGPTGECSETLSRQVADLPQPLKPRIVICDSGARGSFLWHNGHRYGELRRIGLKGWGWGVTKAFRLETVEG